MCLPCLVTVARYIRVLHACIVPMRTMHAMLLLCFPGMWTAVRIMRNVCEAITIVLQFEMSNDLAALRKEMLHNRRMLYLGAISVDNFVTRNMLRYCFR